MGFERDHSRGCFRAMGTEGLVAHGGGFFGFDASDSEGTLHGSRAPNLKQKKANNTCIPETKRKTGYKLRRATKETVHRAVAPKKAYDPATISP